ncbi:MAG TPA: MerR family transcriptional regulator [Frankiaceae bacterium]|jgi:DNA-binding transcriptional MerR regulator|nr:MerR family transcriptional regulator [Frankiaceae bacterium]
MTTASSRIPAPDPEHAPSAQPAQLALAEDLAPAPLRGAPDLTIGEVLNALLPDFPELTISKIRYYERQGLLRPARSAAGYRKFSAVDVARLHYILTAARDQYLPLKVIKERLEAADSGGIGMTEAQFPAPDAADVPEAAGPPPARSGLGVGPELFDFETSDMRLTRRELMRDSGLDNEQLTELEAYGLIAPRGTSTTYEAEALVIARIVAELSAYGFQARHLRPVKAAVDREVGLIEQVLTPMVRQASREGRGRAETQAREYAALSVRLHVALLEAALRATLR